MANQPVTRIDPPISKGSRTTRGRVANGRDKIFVSPPPPIASENLRGPSSVGERIFVEGPASGEVGSIKLSEREFGVIQICDADLSDDQFATAQILWVLRWLGRSPNIKPLSEWTIGEIIAFARGCAPGVSE